MNDATAGARRADRDELFPEFRLPKEERDTPETEPQAEPERPKREPLLLSVMNRLAKLLAEETEILRSGDFEKFAELQREKGELIRQAERLQTSRSAMKAIDAMNPEDLKGRLDTFNDTVETNMRSLGAVKDAITHVRDQAIRKLEEEKGDGVYARDGARKSLHRLSLTENKVKL